MKKRSLNTRLYLMYSIALLPLVFFGLYKNGFGLYRKGFVDFIGSLQPFVILFLSILGSILGGFLRELHRGSKNDISIIDKLKCDIIEAVLIVAIIPIYSNPWIVLAATFVSSLFLAKSSWNRVAIMYLAIEGANVLLGLNDFNNVYEASTILNYNGFDLFFGSGAGGMFSTNIFLIILALIFLSFNKLYKKEMVLSSLLIFTILGVVPHMLMGQYAEIFPYVFGYNILFILVFIAPNLYSSSYTVKGQIVSGVIIGLLTYILSFWTPYTSAILAVLFVSITKDILDRIFVIK